MDDFNLDDENELSQLEEKQSRAGLAKSVLSGMGGMLQAQANVPSAYEYLYKKVGEPTDFQGSFDKMAASVGDPMDKASKAQAYLKAKREGRAGAREEQVANDELDANSADSVAMREQIAGVFPQYAKFVEGKSKAQIREMMPILSKKIEGDTARENARISAGNRAQDRADLYNMRKEDKEEARQLKLEEKMQTLAVPGYELDGSVVPKAEEAAKFRKATAVSDQLTKKINRMKELVKSHGSYEYGGEGGQEMESLATEIQLLGKSPELYELGVLTGPDLSLLNKITSSPDSWASMFTRDGTRQKQLDTQLTSITQKLDSTSRSLGYKKAGEAPRDLEAEQYAAKHGISYDEALKVKAARTSNIGKN